MFIAFAAVLILLTFGLLYFSHYMAWGNDGDPLIVAIILEVITAVAGVLEATAVSTSRVSSAGANIGYAVGVWICVLGVGGLVIDGMLLHKRYARPKGSQWLPYVGLGLLGAAFITGGIFQFVLVS